MEKREPLPEFEAQTVQPVASRYTDYVIPAPQQNNLRSELTDFAIYTKSEIGLDGSAV